MGSITFAISDLSPACQLCTPEEGGNMGFHESVQPFTWKNEKKLVTLPLPAGGLLGMGVGYVGGGGFEPTALAAFTEFSKVLHVRSRLYPSYP